MNFYNNGCFTSTLTLESGTDFTETITLSILTEWEETVSTPPPVWVSSSDT